jgi:hypothetical protein
LLKKEEVKSYISFCGAVFYLGNESKVYLLDETLEKLVWVEISNGIRKKWERQCY